MGNSFSTQEKIISHAKRGEYHQLRTLLDHLQSSSPEYRRNPKVVLDVSDPDGNTPLLTACIRGHFQVAELLLQRGATVNIQNQKSDGGSALHEAINRRHEHVIALLLRYHADPFVENIKSYTPMDFACQTRNVDLLRRLECLAPWRGWLELKVPVALTLGLSSEWKRRWVVICPRIPSPFAPPNRRRTHVSLLCYKSTHDTTPDCRVWLDGARAVEVNDNPRARQRTGGRTPSQMELKLHRSHSAPSGCVTTGNSREGYSLHFRPDEGSARGCSELRQWAEIVNNRGIMPPGGVNVPGGVAQPQPHRPAAVAGPTITTATQAPVLLSTPPHGGATPSSAPDFSPLSQGSSRLSDAELARRLQSEEDERLARELSSNLNVAFPTAGGGGNGASGTIENRPSSQGVQYTNTGMNNRPISQPSQDVGVLFYPSISYDTNQGGTPTPPRPSPPPTSHIPPNTISPSSFIGSTSSMIQPSAPIESRPASQAPSAAAAAAASDSGICCVCLDAKATYGFIHSEGVCVNLCADDAQDYLQRGDRKCPICRQQGEIKKIFIH